MAPANNRWELLGATRFILAGIVVLVHLQKFCPQSWIMLGAMQLSGFAAVVGFLIISGYSISHSISRRREQFFVRRFVRVYPLYLATLVLSVACDPLGRHPDAWYLRTVLGNVVFLQNIRYMPLPGNQVVWTLAVEVFFYAITPLLAMLSNAQLIAASLLSAGCFAAFAQTHPSVYYLSMLHGQPVMLLGWAWLAGFIYQRTEHRAISGPLLVGGVLCLTWINHLWSGNLQIITYAVVFSALILGGRVVLSPKLARLACRLGDLSYPLYLVHVPIYLLVWSVSPHLAQPWMLVACGCGAAMVLLALDNRAKKPLMSFCTAKAEAVDQLVQNVLVTGRELPARVIAAYN